jgi:nitrate reductase NapE component
MPELLGFCYLIAILLIPICYIGWKRKCFNEVVTFSFLGCGLLLCCSIPDIGGTGPIVWNFSTIVPMAYAVAFFVLSLIACGKSTPNKKLEAEIVEKTCNDCADIARPIIQQQTRVIWLLRKQWAYAQTKVMRSQMLDIERHLEVTNSETDRKNLKESLTAVDVIYSKWCKSFNKINKYEKTIRETNTETPKPTSGS